MRQRLLWPRSSRQSEHCSAPHYSGHWARSRCSPPLPRSRPLWTDTPLARLEALALIQTLNGEILSSDQRATLTLEQWCRDHALADKPQVIAHPVAGASATPTAVQRRELQVSAHEIVRYRRVELTCGAHVLSIADNWYVPSRLTPEMNQLLDNNSLTPFGKVVRER